MSKLRKRDDTDRDSERERSGAALVITRKSSTKLRSFRTPISHGVEIEVCSSVSNNVQNVFQERDCARPKMKPSKMPPNFGNGKLAERESS